MIAILSVAANVLSIPGVAVICDFALLETEVNHLQKDIGTRYKLAGIAH
jgi:hypothetical protein